MVLVGLNGTHMKTKQAICIKIISQDLTPKAYRQTKHPKRVPMIPTGGNPLFNSTLPNAPLIELRRATRAIVPPISSVCVSAADEMLDLSWDAPSEQRLLHYKPQLVS